ncbi:MAG: AEC family transporter [Alphaproteobacteria bacterium]|nr:AEC family transporter [Alphaproteobacteria bacterium]
MWYELFSIIAPLFVCAGLGFGWARRKLPFDTQMITPLTMNIAVPCLILASVSTLPVDPRAFGELVAAVIVVLACFMAIGALTLVLTGYPVRTFLPALMFPNVGNMGLPLCLFAFGDIGLAFGMAWYVIAAVANFSIGIWIASGSSALGSFFKSPILYALAIAFGFMTTGIEPPKWFLNTVRLLGNMGIPLMLLALGVSLSSLKIVGLRRTLALSVLRLGMGFAVGYGVAELFGLTGPARGVLILDSAMPVAVFNYMLAERYGRDPSEVASMVVVSTTLAFLTLPLLLLAVLPS